MATIWHDDEVGDDPVDRTTQSDVDEVEGSTIVRSAVTSSGQPVNPTPDDTTKPKKTISLESGIAPLFSFWHDFNLEAIPHYNYWEESEEESNPKRETQEVVDLPRFVKLVWDAAPDLKDPDEFKKKSLTYAGPGVRNFKQLSPFGFGAWEVQGTSLEGTNYSPEYLQPSNFEKNCAKCANGFIASGIVSAVVNTPSEVATDGKQENSRLLDEDQYLLNHKKNAGIPYGAANLSLWRRVSGIVGAQRRLYGRATAKTANSTKQNLAFGQFGLSRGKGGRFSLKAGSADAVSHKAKETVTTKPVFDRTLELWGDELEGRGHVKKDHNVGINFIHTDFTGYLTQGRLAAASQPHHLDSLTAVAQNVTNLQAASNAGFQHMARDLKIPSDRAPNTLKPLEYIGYVIEKWELIDNSYSLVDTIYVAGREYTEYFDSEVKYGVSYRYRIKAIVRWSRPHGVGVLGKEDTQIDAPGVNVDSLTPNDVSYFYTDWNHDWAYSLVIDTSPPPPPDELVVMPFSNPLSAPGGQGPAIMVTFKLPHNPQLDINKMTLYRKIVDESGEDRTGWVPVREFLENPEDPSRQGTRKTLTVSYQHQQDDITGTKFNVTEKEGEENIVEYGPTNSIYIDRDVEYWGEEASFQYVYAAVCYTRHGEESPLSDQVGARLNPDWRKTGEFPITFWSCAGVQLGVDMEMFSTYPEQRIKSELITRQIDPDPSSIGVTIQERTASRMLQDTSYTFRVESLDTGEYIDVPVNVKVDNVPEDKQEYPMDALVVNQG